MYLFTRYLVRPTAACTCPSWWFPVASTAPVWGRPWTALWSALTCELRWSPSSSASPSPAETRRRRKGGIVGERCRAGAGSASRRCLLEMILLPCWTVSWAAFPSHGTRPGRERAWPVPEPAPRPDASSSRRPRWRPPSDPELLRRTKEISQKLVTRAHQTKLTLIFIY